MSYPINSLAPLSHVCRYGFDYGPVHFVLMSTEHDFRENTTQYIHLVNDLKAVDRSKTPWLVFAGHRLVSECYTCKSIV